MEDLSNVICWKFASTPFLSWSVFCYLIIWKVSDQQDLLHHISVETVLTYCQQTDRISAPFISSFADQFILRLGPKNFELQYIHFLDLRNANVFLSDFDWTLGHKGTWAIVYPIIWWLLFHWWFYNNLERQLFISYNI